MTNGESDSFETKYFMMKLNGYKTAICGSAKKGVPENEYGFQKGKIPFERETAERNFPG